MERAKLAVGWSLRIIAVLALMLGLGKAAESVFSRDQMAAALQWQSDLPSLTAMFLPKALIQSFHHQRDYFQNNGVCDVPADHVSDAESSTRAALMRAKELSGPNAIHDVVGGARCAVVRTFGQASAPVGWALYVLGVLSFLAVRRVVLNSKNVLPDNFLVLVLGVPLAGLVAIPLISTLLACASNAAGTLLGSQIALAEGAVFSALMANLVWFCRAMLRSGRTPV